MFSASIIWQLSRQLHTRTRHTHTHTHTCNAWLHLIEITVASTQQKRCNSACCCCCCCIISGQCLGTPPASGTPTWCHYPSPLPGQLQSITKTQMFVSRRPIRRSAAPARRLAALQHWQRRCYYYLVVHLALSALFARRTRHITVVCVCCDATRATYGRMWHAS